MSLKVGLSLSFRLFALTCAATSLLAGQRKTAKPAPAARHTGEVSGFIFLITRAGDLKPARLAQVYLFRSDLADAYDVTVVKQRSLFEEGLPPDTELSCETRIEVYDRAIRSALKAARDQDADDAFHVLQADEEGKFQFRNVEAGDYEILVLGRAGANDAYWSQRLRIDAGRATKVKLGESIVSCLNLGD